MSMNTLEDSPTGHVVVVGAPTGSTGVMANPTGSVGEMETPTGSGGVVEIPIGGVGVVDTVRYILHTAKAQIYRIPNSLTTPPPHPSTPTQVHIFILYVFICIIN